MFVFLWLWHYAEHRGDGRASPRLHSRAVTRIGVLADARDSSFEILPLGPTDAAACIADTPTSLRIAKQADRAGRESHLRMIIAAFVGGALLALRCGLNRGHQGPAVTTRLNRQHSARIESSPQHKYRRNTLLHTHC